MQPFDYKDEETLDWFPAYQTLPYEGEPKGWRDKDNSRVEKIIQSDIYGKSVLDIGCNVGALLHYARILSAGPTGGVDCMEDTITLARKIAEHYGQCIIYIVANILHEDFTAEFEEKFERVEFNTVLFLSVYHSIVQKHRLLDPEEIDRIWEHLDKVTGEVLYFEGHGNETEQQYRDLFKKYLPTYAVNFLGMNHDYLNENFGGRPFFRLVKHRHYDIKDPSFKPRDIWKKSLGELQNQPISNTTWGPGDIFKNIKKEHLPIDTIENYDLIVGDKGMTSLKFQIDNGELIRPPLLRPRGRKYAMFDGIHRSSLYFHMFPDEEDIPCIVLNPPKGVDPLK